MTTLFMSHGKKTGFFHNASVKSIVVHGANTKHNGARPKNTELQLQVSNNTVSPQNLLSKQQGFTMAHAQKHGICTKPHNTTMVLVE